MVSGRHGRHHEAVMAAIREEAMHPLIIQAIAADRVRARHAEAAAWQRAAWSRRTGAGRPRARLRWPGQEDVPALRRVQARVAQGGASR